METPGQPNERDLAVKALWLSQERLECVELPPPRPGRGECLVRVILAGICGTDLALQRGLYQFSGVPGHEFVGRVEEGSADLAGQRVVADINLTCGRCENCRRRRSKHCARRRVLGLRGAQGAFAQWLTIPESNLNAVPETVSDDQAVWAEPLAAALTVLEDIDPRDPGPVLVVGAGRLGQLMVRVLQSAGCDVRCLGRSPQRLARLPKTVQGKSDRTLLEPARFDRVIDCSGTPEGLRTALDALHPGGILVLKSTLSGVDGIDLNRLVVDEIRIHGSRCGSMAKALEWLAAQRVSLASLVSHRFPLEQGVGAFETSARTDACKVLLVP